MNVAELQTNVYNVAGLRNTDILRFRSYPGKGSGLNSPEALGATRSFSEILSDHIEAGKKNVSAAQAYSEMSADTLKNFRAELSEPELESLRNSLNMKDLSPDVVNALTDDNGNIADKLIDVLLDPDDKEDASAQAALDKKDISSLVSGNKEDNGTPELNKLLTDMNLAKEYLSSQSGRMLINAMADNMISGVVTDM
ncbi:hypothetical protein SAMN02910370_01772 [Lachnospiraceae bacterium XPB1003]|nr:hypothetical protein SAMN02910370_01772 [Lachnospiraceae bacterium XPB1003]